jgi:hypothetical protein
MDENAAATTRGENSSTGKKDMPELRGSMSLPSPEFSHTSQFQLKGFHAFPINALDSTIQGWEFNLCGSCQLIFSNFSLTNKGDKVLLQDMPRSS